MAIKTIGAAGDYTTIALWSTYVKALVTLAEDEEGQLIDDAAYTYGASTDLNFNTVTLGAFSILLRGTGSGVNDGDFGNGARVIANVGFNKMYDIVKCEIKDFSIENTGTSGGAISCFNANLTRVIASTLGSTIQLDENSTAESCRALHTAGKGFHLIAASTSILNCTNVGGDDGFVQEFAANAGVVQNNVSYLASTGFSGTWSGTNSNNASDDGTHPGTSGVTLTGNPFEADGYTPSASGELDGLGVNLSITLDAANNLFNNPPSIGAYEIVIASITIDGDILDDTNERDILSGPARTMDFTLSALADWKAAGTGPIGSTSDSQEILDGVTFTTNQAGGYNLQVKPNLTPTDLTRVSDKIARLTLPLFPLYDIVDNEIGEYIAPVNGLQSGGPLSEVGGGAGSLIIGDSQMSELTIDGTNQFVTVSIIDTNGDPLTGLTFNSAGLTASYVREGVTVAVDITLVTMVLNTWASGGFKEIDATKQPGDYQLGVPDALAVAGTFSAKIIMLGAATMRQANHPVNLVNLIVIGSDDKVEVSSDAHTSGQTIAANAAIDTTGGSIDNVALVATTTTTTTNTDMRGTDSAALATDLATLSTKISTLAIPKNAIFADFNVLMLLTADNQPALLKAVTVERSIDGGAFAAATGSIVELSDGLYTFDSTAADTNGDSIVWLFKADDCNNAVVAFQTVR